MTFSSDCLSMRHVYWLEVSIALDNFNGFIYVLLWCAIYSVWGRQVNMFFNSALLTRSQQPPLNRLVCVHLPIDVSRWNRRPSVPLHKVLIFTHTNVTNCNCIYFVVRVEIKTQNKGSVLSSMFYIHLNAFCSKLNGHWVKMFYHLHINLSW